MQGDFALALGDHGDAGHALFAGQPLGARNLDQLVALALVQFRQFGDREHQQVAFAGDHHDAVAGRIGTDARGQDARAIGQADDLLAGLVAPEQRAEAGDEAVAEGGGQYQVGVAVGGNHRVEAGAGGGAEARGQRFAVAARRGQGVRGGGITAAGGIDEGDLLRGARVGRRQQAVALAEAEALGVHVVALGRTRETLTTEHHGQRLAADQRALVQRLRHLAFDQRRAPRVAVLCRVGAQLFLDQALELGRGFQQHVDARALLFQLVALG